MHKCMIFGEIFFLWWYLYVVLFVQVYSYMHQLTAAMVHKLSE